MDAGFSDDPNTGMKASVNKPSLLPKSTDLETFTSAYLDILIRW